MAEITFTDKVSRRTSNAPATEQIRAEDINEIKASVNAIYTEGVGSGVGVTGLLTSLEVLSLNTTPFTLVADQGSNKLVYPKSLILYYPFNTTAYTTNLDIQIRYGGGADLLIVEYQNFLDIITGVRYSLDNNIFKNSNVTTDILNEPIILTVANGDPLAGDGPLYYNIEYTVIDFNI